MDVSACKTYPLILPVSLDSQREHNQVFTAAWSSCSAVTWILSGFADRFFCSCCCFGLFVFFFFTLYDPGPAVFQCLAHPEKISYITGIKLDFLLRFIWFSVTDQWCWAEHSAGTRHLEWYRHTLNAKSVYCAFNVGHEDSSRVKESDFFYRLKHISLFLQSYLRIIVSLILWIEKEFGFNDHFM